jgi:hypothetical protein
VSLAGAPAHHCDTIPERNEHHEAQRTQRSPEAQEGMSASAVIKSSDVIVAVD